MLDRFRRIPEGVQGVAVAGVLGLVALMVALLLKLIA
jgi:hypothetical protein